MRQSSGTPTSHGEKVVKDIRRATRRLYSAEEKIKIVLNGKKGEDSIEAVCRREGIAQSLNYNWSKELLEVGKKWHTGDTAQTVLLSSNISIGKTRFHETTNENL